MVPAGPPTRYVARVGVDRPGLLVSIRMTASTAWPGTGAAADRCCPAGAGLDSGSARQAVVPGQDATPPGHQAF
jgi:hypothetical protein